MAIEIKRCNPEVDNLEEITDYITRAYDANRQFFGQDVAIVKYVFLYSREEMDQCNGKKTKDNRVGVAWGDEVIIFSPSAFAKESCHSQKSFYPVLIHETSHVFISYLFGFRYPMWLAEGIPGYVAGQYKGRDERTLKEGLHSFQNLHSLESWQQREGYSQAYSFTRYLFESLGKEKMLDLASRLGNEDSFRIFSKRFKETSGITLGEIKKAWISNIKKINNR